LFGTSNSIPTNVMQEQNKQGMEIGDETEEEDSETEKQEEKENVIPMDVISGTNQNE